MEFADNNTNTRHLYNLNSNDYVDFIFFFSILTKEISNCIIESLHVGIRNSNKRSKNSARLQTLFNKYLFFRFTTSRSLMINKSIFTYKFSTHDNFFLHFKKVSRNSTERGNIKYDYMCANVSNKQLRMVRKKKNKEITERGTKK